MTTVEIVFLGVYFAVHTLFTDSNPLEWGPVHLEIPVWASLHPWALLLTIAAVLMIFRFRWSVLRTLGVCAAASLLIGLLPS